MLLLPHTAWRWGLFCWLSALAAGSVSANDDLRPLEYQVKAGFLYNFVMLSEWPTNTFATTNSPIVVAVLGQDPFRAKLDKAFAGKSVNGHPVVLVRYERLQQFSACHLLFIPTSERARLPSIMARLQGQPTLTVSDMAQFAEAGGMIELIKHVDTIRFRINTAAVERTGITVSSRLLQLASMGLGARPQEKN